MPITGIVPSSTKAGVPAPPNKAYIKWPGAQIVSGLFGSADILYCSTFTLICQVYLRFFSMDIQLFFVM